MKKIYLLLTALLLACTTNTYRRTDFAIAFIRGLNGVYGSPSDIANAIRTVYPNIPYVELSIGDGSAAATQTGMYRQLSQLYSSAISNATLAGKHVILIGGSQGGLLAQAFVEMYGHRLPFTIDSLMTIAGPLGGQYGLPSGWEATVDTVVWHGDSILLQELINLFGIKSYTVALRNGETLTIGEALDQAKVTRDILDPLRTLIAQVAKDFIRNNFSLIRFIFYNAIGQDLVSVAGYWRDPNHKSEYLASNSFLPYINNEITHADSNRYRSNLVALNRIVFFWAGQDGTVTPSCSGSKRFYRWGSTTELENSFRDTMQYQQNLLGLGTMLDIGRLFIEYLPNDGHSCNSAEAIAAGLRQFDAIVNSPAPNDIFDAVRANDLAAVQSLITAHPALLLARDGFNNTPIYYAGDKLAIAQYLFAQYLAQGKPVDIATQDTLAYNAAGSGSLAVLQWLIESLYYNPAPTYNSLLQIATQNGQPAVVNYLQSMAPITLSNAIVQNNQSLVSQMVAANPLLIAQLDASNMLPIYYAGNRLTIAQQLFALHLRYSPLTLAELGALLYFAFGSGSLDVAQWIIETLYFDPTSIQAALFGIAANGTLTTYLQTFFAQNRTTIFAAVQNNDLTTVQQIAAKNPANVEERRYDMLPILYAGNKLAIAEYLYSVHQQLGRPLPTSDLAQLLYFAFGSGSLEVAQWMVETLNFDPRPTKDALISIARANGQTQMITYLASLGIW